MTFKIIAVETKELLHERQLDPYEIWILPLLVRQWADANGVLVDTKDENTPGTADIDASITGFLFTNTASSFFYL